MTDDERTDHARRIREMREGSRPTDEESNDDQPATRTDDAGAELPDSAPDGGDTQPEPATDADGADGAGDPADETGAAETSDEGTVHVPGAEVGDVDVDVEAMADQAGLTATTEGGEETAVEPAASGAAARAEAAETESGEETRVLEFALGDEQYCLDIEYVEEIVKRETVTRVPNTPGCVEGVVDLRGQITTILDPKVLLDIPEVGSRDLIVVFDPEEFDDQGAVGWVVDDVNQVTPITGDEVNEPPVDQDHVNGVVDRDGDFVIWTTPELDLDEVVG